MVVVAAQEHRDGGENDYQLRRGPAGFADFAQVDGLMSVGHGN